MGCGLRRSRCNNSRAMPVRPSRTARSSHGGVRRARPGFACAFSHLRAALRRAVACVAVCAALAGCATMSQERPPANDPFEPVNRQVFAFNDAFQTKILTPIAKAYIAVVPEFFRDRFRAFVDNLAEPRIFVNDLLQARVNAAGMTFTRFVANSILGVGGLFDYASAHGFPRQSGDFGQTLYAWGVESGPYLVLPFLGSSNPRDTLGLGVDFATTPPALVVHGRDAAVASFAISLVDGVDL